MKKGFVEPVTMFLQFYLLICFFVFKDSVQNDIKGFDDTVLFSLNWPGEFPLENEEIAQESIIVTSSHKEKYKCSIPTVIEKETSKEEKYSGPSALELLSPLFTQSMCSFKLESYWTYEVCHGRYIRQYHEDREGKTVKVQEYILGKWDGKHLERLLLNSKDDEAGDNDPVAYKKIDNVNLPYFEVAMDNGTLCDLNNNKPRMTKILYVCYIHGKHEIYSLKETSTCVYEIIILSPTLCTHPKYKPKDTGEHKINCVPMDGSFKKPYALAKMLHDSYMQKKKAEKDRFKVELVKIDKEPPLYLKDKESKLLDSSPVESFLLGKNCLNGGTGWWKFEFCYGKSIEQYHIERDGSKTSIKLGIFNKEHHLEWMKQNPHKRPKPLGQRKHLSHFYSEGDVCDKSGKPRQTEVKLKCLNNPSSPNAVSLYLLEPKECEYILGVESPLICDILARADENGLVEIGDDDEKDSETKTTINIRL